MAIDDRFQIVPEVSVERHGRAVGFRQRDGFREQTARMRLCRPQYGHGPRVIFDDDFRACAHVGQQRRDVGRGCFCFRDVDHFLSHDLIIHPHLFSLDWPFTIQVESIEEVEYERVLPHSAHHGLG